VARNIVGLSRAALSIGTTVAMLAGCGQPQTVGNGMLPQSAAPAGHAAHGKSWMEAGASSQDLMYLSDGDNGNVYVLTYPQGQEVGTLTGLNAHGSGECADSIGDIFVTTSSAFHTGTIYEFAHGGTTPIATLSDPGAPAGCSFDQVTGNLAVSNYYDESNYGNGDVAIYTQAQGSPALLKDGNQYEFYRCGYDNAGNLFVSTFANFQGKPALLEVPSGSDSFVQIAVKFRWDDVHSSTVQWDGSYITVSTRVPKTHATQKIIRLSISGTAATGVGRTEIEATTQDFGPSWIQAGRIVAVYSHHGRDVGIWAYPQGSRQRRLKDLSNEIAGVTVSVVPSGLRPIRK